VRGLSDRVRDPQRVPRPPRRGSGGELACAPRDHHARAKGVLPLAVLVGLVVLGLALAWPRPAAAEDLTPPLSPAARELYEAGLAHYAARRFPAAIEALRAAYALEPRREILFAEAQATRLGGDCRGAVPLYQRFLDSDPPPRQLEAARIALGRCREVLEKPPPGTTAPPAVPPPVTAAPPTPAGDVPPLAPRSPWYRDPTAAILAGTALAALAVGTGYVIAAFQANDKANRGPIYRDYEADRIPAESRLRTGRLLLLGGAILGASAAGRYLWLGWSPGGREARLAVGGHF
jgi:tetratricopeptide (TPR) repeat protein